MSLQYVLSPRVHAYLFTLLSLLAPFVVASAQKPEVLLQKGHTLSIDVAVFSPKGNLIATGSADKTVKLWDAATGIELRTLVGHVGSVNAVAFSPDGGTVFSGDYEDEVIAWDVETGAELRRFTGHYNQTTALAVSGDGQLLAGGGNNSTIWLWEVRTGKKVRTLKGEEGVKVLAFSHDGRTLAAFAGGILSLWEVRSGQRVSVPGALGSSTTSEVGKVYELAFAPDDKLLAGGLRNGALKLWDAASGRELRTLSPENFRAGLAFSPDGRTLATRAGVKKDSSASDQIVVWDVSTGRAQRELSGAGGVETRAVALAFLAGGAELCGIAWDGQFVYWDTATGKVLRSHRNFATALSAIAFSRDGKTLAAGGSLDYSLFLWDMVKGQLRTLAKPQDGGANLFAGGAAALSFSADKKLLAAGYWTFLLGGWVSLWDVEQGKNLGDIKTGAGIGGVSAAELSPDGRLLVIYHDSTTAEGGKFKGVQGVSVWDAQTGSELKKLKSIGQVGFSPDGKYLAQIAPAAPAGGRDRQALSLLSTTDFSEQRLITASGVVNSFAFSRDARVVALLTYSGLLELHDVAGGSELLRFEVAASDRAGHDNTLALSADGLTVATGNSWGGPITLWDAKTGKPLRRLAGHAAGVKQILFNPAGTLLVSTGNDYAIKLWDVASGEELASLFALGSKGWLAVTPDGLFDGSPAAWRSIYWRFSKRIRDIYPIEGFFNEFYYPGLLADIYAGKRPKARADIAAKDRRGPELSLSMANAPEADKEFTSAAASVKVKIANAPAGARDVRLFRNGTLIRIWRGDVTQAATDTTLEATVPAVAGENRLVAYAFNRDNVKGDDAQLTFKGAGALKRIGTAYILAVGVNEYSNPQFNLRYAVPDARLFAEEVSRQQGRVLKYEKVEAVTLLDAEATKENLLLALRRLADTQDAPLPKGAPASLEKLKHARPEDAVIIYFAGHGTAQGNRFYLIPHDLGYTGSRTELNSSGLQNILAHSISDEEMEKAVEGIDTGQMVLVIDACNSGQALEAEEKRRGPMNSKGLAQLAYEKGMYVLAASKGYQVALEASEFGHGLLTYALVGEGLQKGAADRGPKDERITLREWLDYAVGRVPKLQHGQFTRGRQIVHVTEPLDEEEEEASLAAKGLQSPQAYYRGDDEGGDGSQSFTVGALNDKNAFKEAMDAASKAADYTTAERAYRAAARIDPKDSRPYAGLLRIYSAQLRFDEAVEAGRQLLRVKPDEVAVRADLSLLLLMAGRRDESAAELVEYQRLETDKVKALGNLGKLDFAQGNNGAAEQKWRQAAGLDKNGATWLRALAALYLLTGRDAEAFALSREALQAKPGEYTKQYIEYKDLFELRVVAEMMLRKGVKRSIAEDETYQKSFVVAHLLLREAGRKDEANAALILAVLLAGGKTRTQEIIKYLLRAVSMADLLAASASDPAFATRARTFVALDLALEGKRAEAIENLRWVKERGDRKAAEYGLAMAELVRLEAGSR